MGKLRKIEKEGMRQKGRGEEGREGGGIGHFTKGSKFYFSFLNFLKKQKN